MTPIVFNWRHLAVVTSTLQNPKHFMEDLKRLAYWKIEAVFTCLQYFDLDVLLGIINKF